VAFTDTKELGLQKNYNTVEIKIGKDIAKGPKILS
jgi:hypothetical protein